MALIHTLMRLKDDGIVLNFDMIDRQKARVNLVNGKSIVVFMADDYIVGITAVREAIATEPRPDYIVYNHWNKITDNAEAEAKRIGIPLVSYGKFRGILDNELSRYG